MRKDTTVFCIVLYVSVLSRSSCVGVLTVGEGVSCTHPPQSPDGVIGSHRSDENLISDFDIFTLR